MTKLIWVRRSHTVPGFACLHYTNAWGNLACCKAPVMKLVLHLPGDPNHWYAAARSSTPKGLPKLLLLLWFCIGGVCVGFEIALCNPGLVSGGWLSKMQK